jgi:hypothetical protein
MSYFTHCLGVKEKCFEIYSIDIVYHDIFTHKNCHVSFDIHII